MFSSVCVLQRCDKDGGSLQFRSGRIEDLDGWFSNFLKGDGLGSYCGGQMAKQCIQLTALDATNHQYCIVCLTTKGKMQHAHLHPVDPVDLLLEECVPFQ